MLVDSSALGPGSGAAPQASWEVGHNLFAMAIGFLALGAVSGAASVAGLAISSERERKTLDLLEATAMTPGVIVAGKLLTPALLVLGACALIAPALAVVEGVLGGFTFGQLLAALAVVFTFSMLVASLALCSGCTAARSSDSIAALASVLGGVLPLVAFFSLLNGSWYTVPASLNPANALSSILSPDVFRPGCPWPAWIPCLILCGMGTVFFALLARDRLSRPSWRDVAVHRRAGLAWLAVLQIGLLVGLAAQHELAARVSLHELLGHALAVATLPVLALCPWLGTRPARAGARGASLVRRDLVVAALIAALGALTAAGAVSLLAGRSAESWRLASGSIPDLDGSPATWPLGSRVHCVLWLMLLPGLSLAVSGKILARRCGPDRTGRALVLVAALAAATLIAPRVLVRESGLTEAGSPPLAPVPQALRIVCTLDVELAIRAVTAPGHRILLDRDLFWSQRLAPDPWSTVALQGLLLSLLVGVSLGESGRIRRGDPERPP
jgi:ABC-type Na+ efflux pump permease subunit